MLCDGVQHQSLGNPFVYTSLSREGIISELKFLFLNELFGEKISLLKPYLFAVSIAFGRVFFFFNYA